MLQVTTESGAVYIFEQGLGRVMRQPSKDSDNVPLRRDGEWLNVKNLSLTAGESMVLDIEALATDCLFTRRVTTPVTDVRWLGTEKDKPPVRRVACDRYGDWRVY